jgi:hypothetical protein
MDADPPGRALGRSLLRSVGGFGANASGSPEEGEDFGLSSAVVMTSLAPFTHA